MTTCRSVTHATPNTQSLCPCHTRTTLSVRSLLRSTAAHRTVWHNALLSAKPNLCHCHRPSMAGRHVHARMPLKSAMSQAAGWMRQLTTSVCTGSISSGELEAPLLSLMRMTWQSAGLVPPVARNCLQRVTHQTLGACCVQQIASSCAVCGFCTT